MIKKINISVLVFCLISIALHPLYGQLKFDTSNTLIEAISNEMGPLDNHLVDDIEIQRRIENLHTHVWNNFVHPELKLIYDYIAPLNELDRWAHLPTIEEIRKGKPNLPGWGTGMEDSALNGGAYLAGLVWRFEVTREKKHAEEARSIYDGLRILGTIPGHDGFVARAVLPDGTSFYPNSSADQYTLFVFGLWTYFRSSISTDEERNQIALIINNICKRLERDNFEALSAEGKKAQYCDIGNISPDRSSRLLEILMIGYIVTEDNHWLDIYNAKLSENKFARLYEILTPSKLEKYEVYSILQNQVSLIPLFEHETFLPIRTSYLEGLKLNASVAEKHVMKYKEYDENIHSDDYTLGGWRTGRDPRSTGMNAEFKVVRNPCEAMLVMLLADDKYLLEKFDGVKESKYTDFLSKTCREMLLTYNYEKMRSYGFIYAEIVYWLAVKQGLLKYSVD